MSEKKNELPSLRKTPLDFLSRDDPGAHYATWPTALCTIPIKTMCPRERCNTCGEPRRRTTGDPEYVKPDGTIHQFHGDGFTTNPQGGNSRIVTGADNGNMVAIRETLGWTDCGHDNYRPGIVLDPFAGTGTTLAVATGHGRTAIGIDLDHTNLELARQRIGPLLFNEQLPEHLTETVTP